MLIKATELVAWQIRQPNGKPVAKVADILFANPMGELKGVVTEDHVFIDQQYIQQFGDGYLVISESLEAIKKFRKEQTKETKKQHQYCPFKTLLGTTFVNKKGTEIGWVGDVVFNTEQLQILNYEISDGLLKDMVQGRRVVDCSQIAKERFGDRLIVNIEKEWE